MKKLLAGLVVALNIVGGNAFAVTIIQDGITYSCTPNGGGYNPGCATKCVQYCASYDKYPFDINRCLQYATTCGPNASVQTICTKYDTYPFDTSRCLQQEDLVLTDNSCN